MTVATSQLNGIVSEPVTGQSVLVSALVSALHDAGVLNKDAFIDTLGQMWAAMPEDAAVGDQGAVIETMLDSLNGDEDLVHDSASDSSGNKGAMITTLPVDGNVAAVDR